MKLQIFFVFILLLLTLQPSIVSCFHSDESNIDDHVLKWYCGLLLNDRLLTDNAVKLRDETESVYFCHPIKRNAYLRCVFANVQLSALKYDVKKTVIFGEENSCKPGTFFNHKIMACVIPSLSNCPSSSSFSSFTVSPPSKVPSPEQGLCDAFLRLLPLGHSRHLRTRLICDDATNTDFVVCPDNTAEALRMRCVQGKAFNQAKGVCVEPKESDCPIRWREREADHLEVGELTSATRLQRCLCDLVTVVNAKNVAYIADPTDDNLYLLCIKGQRTVPNPCPKTLLWNEDVGTCSRISSRTTSAQFIPTCEHRFSAITAAPVLHQQVAPVTPAAVVVTTPDAVVTTSDAVVTTSDADAHPDGQHGCIGCNITKLQLCVCAAELRRTGQESAYRCDPHTRDRYLVCLSERVTCHPCPEGLAWNSDVFACSKVRKCLGVPPQCIPTTTTTSTTTSTTTTKTPTTTTATTKTEDCVDCKVTAKRLCICAEALKLKSSSEEAAYRCDPDVEDQFLVCKGSDVVCQACAADTKWNSDLKTCTSPRKCLPIPLKCENLSDTSSTVLSSPSLTPTGATTDFTPSTTINPPLEPMHYCVCEETLRLTDAKFVYLCDPVIENRILICMGGGFILPQFCAAKLHWNKDSQKCDYQRKCQPVPPLCNFKESTLQIHITTTTPTTTLSTTTTMPTTTTLPTTTSTLLPLLVCGLRYELSKKKLPWYYARQVCEANLGNLAVILDNKTEECLTERFGSDKKGHKGGVWIGASDSGKEGNWRWVTGQLVNSNTSHWYPGQPSGSRYQHCMQFNYYGKKGLWDDTRCYYKKRFICQYEDCKSDTPPI